MFPVADTEFNFSADFKVYDYFYDIFTSIVECIHSRRKVLLINIVEIILII